MRKTGVELENRIRNKWFPLLVYHGKEYTVPEAVFKSIRRLFRPINEMLKEAEALFKLKKWKNNTVPHDFPIRVGFIVQAQSTWSKQLPVYMRMKEDPCFEPWLIIVPDYDYRYDRPGEYNSDRDIFIAQCGDNHYLLYDSACDFSDFKRLRLDYVFYQRPYDHYLPLELQSKSVAGETRICYIPYATSERIPMVPFPKDFFRNVYLGFADDDDTAKRYRKEFKLGTNRGLQFFLSIGYPVFENCLMKRQISGYMNVLWTPRWTYDPIVGSVK